jgi:hypothetical protein
MSEIHRYFKTKQHDLLKNMNTCAICRIEQVDLSKMKANVVPLFEGELTPILNVPIAAHQTKDFLIRVPYAKGDLVLVVFSQRDIDPILYGGGEPSTRMLGIDDALIVGGINLFTEPLPSVHSEDLVITRKDFSSKIVLKANNDVVIHTDAKVLLGDENAVEGVPLGDTLKEWLDNHTHPTPAGESSPPSSVSPIPSKKVKTV